MKLGLVVTFLLCSSAIRIFAADFKVEVHCNEFLGEASQIQDFLGAGGDFDPILDKPDHPAIKAWQKLKMRHFMLENLEAEEPTLRKLTISRDDKGNLKIDFTDYDRILKGYLNHLKGTPFVYLGNMPRFLSSQSEREDFARYMPRDLKEWKDFVSQIVRHNVEVLGLKGIYYGIPGEPDYGGNFLFKPEDDPKSQLKNHVELCAATYHAVKSVDRAAKVGGPGTMSWKISKWTESAGFTLSDWIKAWAEFNKNRKKEEQVHYDYISWQDYNWVNERISDGADAVSGYLAANGFDPKLPKIMGGSGWGSWSSDYLDTELSDQRRASHTIYNIIREFKDPGQRKFARVYYYFFHSDDWWYPDDKAKMDEMRRTALVRIRQDGSHSFTLIFAAFEIASGLSQNGKIIKTSSDEPVEAMATWNKEKSRLLVAINNHRADSCDVALALKDLPFKEDAKIRFGIQRIDEKNSSDGKGLEAIHWKDLSPKQETAQIKLPLKPYGTVLVSILPFELTNP